MITALILACTLSAPTEGYVVVVPVQGVVADRQPVRSTLKRCAGGVCLVMKAKPVRRVFSASGSRTYKGPPLSQPGESSVFYVPVRRAFRPRGK